MPFHSGQPDIKLSESLSVWNWLFNSPDSTLSRSPIGEVGGYTDCQSRERIGYTDVKKYTTWMSTALSRKYNLGAGDTVVIFSTNNVWYPVAMMAVSRLGGIVSGASPQYNVSEMAYALKKSNAKFLMTVPGSMKIALAAAEKAEIPRERIFVLTGQTDGFCTIQDLLRVGASFGDDQVEPFTIPKGKTNGDVCGFLSFSSGTTGLPKAVMISHQNIIAQCLQIQQITPVTHRRIMAVLPFFHITGLVHILHLPVLLNAEVYMLPTFTMESMLKVVSEKKIEELLLVPPIVIRLVRDPIVDSYDLSCVRRFSSGAAPISKELLQQLQTKFPGTGFKQGYGMTESCSCITAHTPELYDFKYAHTVGTICASTSVKIMDEKGNEVGIDQPGEILARGPQITMGYLNNEEATRNTYLPDGYLRTGDQGKISADGIITITDRIKEIIKVKGIGVAPAELEDLLLGHPQVEDCAVLGIPDDYSGEKPKAYVVAKVGTLPSEALGRQLLEYVKSQKVRHKWLKEVEFTENIPKSASGKILRRELREKSKHPTRSTTVRETEKVTAKL